jgi:hypothetical protein
MLSVIRTVSRDRRREHTKAYWREHQWRWIEGVHGDVSGKTRNQVRPGLERGDKRFAPTSYIRDVHAMLAKRPVDRQWAPMPLHTASLGPFYQLYDIRPRGTDTRETPSDGPIGPAGIVIP